MSSLKVAPHNIEAEQSVIWSIFIDKDSMHLIIDILKKEDFYDEKHQIIWESIVSLFSSHVPIDILTVSNELKKHKRLDDIWWVAYLAELSMWVPTASNVQSYVRIVKDFAVRRKMIKVWDQIMWIGYEEWKPIDESLEEVEKRVFSISQHFLSDKFVHIRDILTWRFEEFAKAHESDPNNERVKWVATWFKEIDETLNGLKSADLIILAARPSMWKTALVLNIAQYACISQRKTICFFSLEMSKEQLVDRLFCSVVWVDSWKLHKWLLSDEDFSKLWNWMDKLTNANLYIDDSVQSSLSEVRAKARRLKMEHWLDLIIVDYLQLMTTWNPWFANNRVQEISEISRNLKALAREMHVPVVALSQLSRQVELRPWKVPMLADLRDSWSIEQDADVVLMLYREDYYEPNTERKWLADLFIRKNRNWPTWRVELLFKSEQMRFFNVEKKHKESVFEWM